MNKTLLGNAAVNTTVVSTLIDTMTCPTDDKPEIVNDATDPVFSRQFARRSNYLLCVSRFNDTYNPASLPGLRPPPKQQGMFMNDLSVVPMLIKDGMSSTCLVGESRQIHSSSKYGPYWGAGTESAVHGVVLPPDQVNYPTYKQFLPNAQDPASPQKLPGEWVFSSWHSGGVNMLFADGSVHFIKNTINPATWWALQTINGGEPLSADSY